MLALPLALVLVATVGAASVVETAISPAVYSLDDLARPDRNYAGRYNLCGMVVRARAKQPDGVTHEWDVALSVFSRGTQRVGAVEAAAFAFERDAADRVVRAPLAEVAFTVAGADGPGTAHMVDGPNSDGGMVGEIAAETAERVFDALDAGTRIRVDLTFVTGMRETVLLRTYGGAMDDGGHFRHGRNAPVRACLLRLVPASAPLGPTRRSPHSG